MILRVGVVDEDHDAAARGRRPSRTFRRGGMRSTTVFSVGRIRDAEPGVYSGLQIDREHDAAARRRAAGPAFGQYRAGRQGAQRAVLHVLLHGLVDALDMGRDVCVLEIDLGQGQTQGRRCVADDAVGLRPVFGLRGVLVTGDDRPFGQVGALAGIMISGIRVQRFAIGIVLLTGITYVFSIAENPRYGTENIEGCNIFLRMLRCTLTKTTI